MLTYFSSFILFLILIVKAKSESCFCFPNQTVTASVTSISLGPPTISGGFGSTSCAANCSTTITFEEEVSQGMPGGEKITIILCQNLSKSNVLRVYADKDLVQTFDSCPTSTYSFTISHTHVYTFNWQLSTPVSAIMVTQPIGEIPPTTPSTKTTPFGYTSVQADIVLILDGSETVNSEQNNLIQNILLNAFGHFTIDKDHINLAVISALGNDYPIPLVLNTFTSIYTDIGLKMALNFSFGNNDVFESGNGQDSLSYGIKQLYNIEFLNTGYRNSTSNHLAIYITTANTPDQSAINEAQIIMQRNLFQFIAVGFQGASNQQSLIELVGGNQNCTIVSSNEGEITKFLMSKIWIAASNGGRYC